MADGNLGTLNVKLAADGTDLNRKITDAKSNMGKFGDAAAKSAKSIAKAFGVAAAAFAGLSARAFLKQEAAVQKVNQALRVTGQFSEEASQEMQRVASAMQEIGTTGDEAALEVQSILIAMGATVDEMESATRATIGLSKGLSISLKGAAALVGKAITGNVSAFSRYGIKIKDVDNAVAEIDARFGRFAETTGSVGDKLQQLSNLSGDVQEKLGSVVLRTADLIVNFDELKIGLEGVNAALEGQGNFLEPVIGFFVDLAAAIAKAFLSFGPFIDLAKTLGVDIPDASDVMRRAMDSLTDSTEDGAAALAKMRQRTEDAANALPRLSDIVIDNTSATKDNARAIEESIDGLQLYDDAWAGVNKTIAAAIEFTKKQTEEQEKFATELEQTAKEFEALEKAMAPFALPAVTPPTGVTTVGAPPVTGAVPTADVAKQAAEVASKFGALGQATSRLITAFGQSISEGLAAVAFELLSRSMAFQNIMASLDDAFNRIVAVLDPVISTVGESLSLAFDAIAKSFEALLPVLELLSSVLRLFTDGLSGLATLIGNIAELLGGVIEEVGDFFEDVFGVDGDPGAITAATEAGVRGPGLILGRTADVIAEEQEVATQAALDRQAAVAEQAAMMEGAFEDLTTDAEDFGDALNDATESLLNVPIGFKVAAARFEAAAPITLEEVERLTGQRAGEQPGAAGAGGTVFNIDKLNINGDGAAVWDEIQRIASWQNFVQHGLPFGVGAPSSLPKQGSPQ